MEKRELNRQLFHLCYGICIVALLYFNIINRHILLAILGLGLIVSLISIKVRLPGISWFLDRFERKSALLPGQGALTFLIGSLIVLYLFMPKIAYASILVLAVGDSVGPIVGMSFGRKKHTLNRQRFIEGTIAGIIAAALCAALFVPFWHAFIGSAFAMLAEAAEIRVAKARVDDNLFVPLLAGLAFWLLGLI
jgi:dolichol kinase